MALVIKHIKKVVYLLASLLAAGLFAYTQLAFPNNELKNIRLTQLFALTALSLIYFTLLPSPLYAAFPLLPFKPIYIKARQALGISAFLFASLHATVSFFKLLKGFEGLAFLSRNYFNAVMLGFTALCILSILALTSFNTIHAKLGRFWKPLHRSLYAAGILILLHATQIGTHFAVLSDTLPQIIITAVILLLILEIIRIDLFVNKKLSFIPRYALAVVLLISLGTSYFLYFDDYISGKKSGSIHATHESIPQGQTPSNTMNHAGMMAGADGTNKFKVETENLANVPINEEFTQKFQIINTDTNTPVSVFNIIHEKEMHTIIVDSTLNYFSHIHPTREDSTFTLNTSLPESGQYLTYLDYQPFGFNEQNSVFPLNAGKVTNQAPKNTSSLDAQKTKTVGNNNEYKAKLKYTSPLTAQNISTGQQSIKFSLSDAATGQPLKDLEPYLGAFGHLIMINRDTYEYIHIHPTELTTDPAKRGGPDIEFKVMTMQKIISAGTYRLFAEFKKNNEIFLVDYTVAVQ